MRHAKFWFGLAFVSVTACGGSDEGGLFGGAGAGGSAGGGATTNGGSAGRATGGSGGGGTGATGGFANGGSAGRAAGGSGGVTTGGAGGAPGGTGGDGGSPGGSGGDGGSPGGSGGDGGNGGNPNGGTGGGGGSSWCAGQCGTSNPKQPGNCYCDDQCLSANDCCPDYGPACHPTAGAGQITCGSGTCSSASQFCCQQFTGPTLTPSCQPHNSSCYGPDIGCDGPEDCGAGQVCCSVPQAGDNNVNFECRQAANCTNQSYRIVCGNDWTVCQDGQSCVPHPWVPQYNYCATTN